MESRQRRRFRGAALAGAVVLGATTLSTATMGAPVAAQPAGAAAERAENTSKRENKRIARRMMVRRHGWESRRQWRCLKRLWERESSWNERAGSPTGSYGVPQAHPGSKMASAGDDWRTSARTQIKWGLRYIENRYGAPCGAWNKFRSAGWY